jgi:hypothetical protein
MQALKQKKYSHQCSMKSRTMEADYLHHHKEFPALIRIVADEMRILPSLVEKDYWIMHVLYWLCMGYRNKALNLN